MSLINLGPSTFCGLLRTLLWTRSFDFCAAGEKLSALHGVLRKQTQRQEADLALSSVQRRAGHQLLQEQVWCLIRDQGRGPGSRSALLSFSSCGVLVLSLSVNLPGFTVGHTVSSWGASSRTEPNAVVYRYTLQASTFQMAILLQYNTEDSYTVQQLTDSTQIKTVSVLTFLPSVTFKALCQTRLISLLFPFIFRTFWCKFCKYC